jgi:RNA ligase (TIGR02306 family)
LQTKADNVKSPIIKFLLRFKWFRKRYVKPKKGGFPAWIVKTDEERIQNLTKLFEIEKANGTHFSVTEKIDGQSGTYFLERHGRKFEFGVCSRNIRLSKPNDSSYWTIAKQLGIEDILKSLIGKSDRIVLQGEILGNGIQGNKYQVSGNDFYAFNLIYPDRKIPTEEMATILNPFGIKTVHVLDSDFTLKDTIPEMVEYAKGKSWLLPINREGVVIRNYERGVSFKVINPDFLLAEKD